MYRPHFRTVIYDTSTTPDTVIFNIGYERSVTGAAVAGGTSIVNNDITSLAAAVALGLTFDKYIQSNRVKGHCRGEVYEQVYDKVSDARGAAPADGDADYTLNADDKAERLTCSFDTVDIGKRQRVAAANRRKKVFDNNSFDADQIEDVPADNG